MAWFNTAAIKAKFNLNADTAIASAQATAELTLSNSVDAAIITEAKGAALAEGHTNYLRQLSVIQSHAYLTYYFLLKDAAHLFTREGLLKSFQANTSAATQQVQMNQTLTPQELAQKKDWALENAKFFLGIYGTIFLEEPGGDDGGFPEIVSTLKYW